MKLKPIENRETAPNRFRVGFLYRLGLAVVWLCLLGVVPAVQGQSDLPVADLKNEYRQAIDELRVAVKAMKRAETLHFHVKSDEAFEYREQWEAAAADAEQAYGKLKVCAVELFLAMDKPDKDLVQIVRAVSRKLYEDGQIGKCHAISKKLVALLPDEEYLKTDLARVAILTNDFETAAEFADGNLGTIEQFPPLEKGLFGYIEKLQDQYSRELELREAEAKADDLPRVELKTNKGDIVIELFENEAPETVGNFVNLVEIGFYDEIIFHPVYKKLLAESGMMSTDRLRSTGYTIYDEHERSDARHHFRGSVCMATPMGKENAGTSIFYILQVPGPHIVDRHTVFGRVISGMDIVDSLQPTAEIDDQGEETTIKDIIPDTILSAKVIRKRDHEYVPNRVKETTEPSK